MEAHSSGDGDWTHPRRLHDLTSAAGYADAVTTIVGRVTGAADPVQAGLLLHQARLQIGADAAAFVSFIPDDGTHASYRFPLACDPAWCFEYQRQLSLADDPWLDYACHHSKSAWASTIGARGSAQQGMPSLADRFGFRSAVIVPAPSGVGLGRTGMLCLGSYTHSGAQQHQFIDLEQPRGQTVCRHVVSENAEVCNAVDESAADSAAQLLLDLDPAVRVGCHESLQARACNAPRQTFAAAHRRPLAWAHGRWPLHLDRRRRNRAAGLPLNAVSASKILRRGV